MGWRQNRYNKKSAAKLGWEPSWFSANDFNSFLVERIRDFQQSHGLAQDGLCGPMTYRRRLSERQANLHVTSDDTGNYIICEGAKIPIEWDKVVNIYDENAKVLPPKNYRRYKKNARNPRMIITHYDVCLSANSCYNVLNRRGISSHFVIDNDGTIYQMVDTQHEGWHAGKRAVNRAAIGIDLSNGVYTKYQAWYRKKGFGSRPIITDAKVHGRKMMDCLGFYDVQINAYKSLVRALCKHYNIPLDMPRNIDGTVLYGVSKDVLKGKYKGIANHFHVTRGKIDTANLDWDKVLNELKD
jgi:peptidoglycan hydrolase-like protein with peptidoglycan-binding domain